MPQDKIIIHGAREHNLKNVTLEIPRDKLVVFTGLSGSGKSSLAFDTLYAEGQRRYVESLSAYARQFLGQMEKPDVDKIEGLSPAISIDQKGVSHNPRSTVGTVTEIYDYLRLLFARIGIPHCPQCGRVIQTQTVEQIVDIISGWPEGTRILILAPLIRGRKGHHQKVFEDIRKAGFARARVNGEIRDVNEEIELDRYKNHSIEAVVDRLTVQPAGDGQSRLADSLETAIKLGEGVVIVSRVEGDKGEDQLFSEQYACPYDGFSLGEIEPRSFSFNTPHGACPACQGLGVKMELDPDLIVPNKDLSLTEGAIKSSGAANDEDSYFMRLLTAVAHHYKIDLNAPFRTLTPEQQQVILHGNQGEVVSIEYTNRQGLKRYWETSYEGVIPNLARRHAETTSDWMRWEIESYMSSRPCPECNGARLKPAVLGVTVQKRNIVDVTHMSVGDALGWVEMLQGKKTPRTTRLSNGEALPTLSAREQKISQQILKEIYNRLGFLVDVGLDYLSLQRSAGTLSGGEAQRIRLATQIGSQLMGVLYILDEPSIGLHPRDNARLIRTLTRMRDLGNTLIVVEHDEETMRTADWIVDMGPGAGEHGGKVVANGPLETILKTPGSLTGKYLSGKLKIDVPETRRPGNGRAVEIIGATENNLKNISVTLPLGKFVVITGVSGSGKSSLIVEVLYKRLAQVFYGAREKPGTHAEILGTEHLDKVIDIDQSPIGRTPRSNPATYTNAFNDIRDLFSQLPESKLRGYKAGRYSFNVKGGRCEACQGDGTIKIEMNFLPDIYVPCEVCKGKRYNRETLQVHYKGKSIADVLDLTVSEAIEFFDAIPSLRRKLQTLHDVGLDYIRLGQPAPTMSGGEAQRVKLSKELSKRSTGQTLYILDEPTTGLHFDDVKRLLGVLQRLADAGNTVVVIEHNLDVIKSADWILDLGPEGGDKGGQLIAEGTPEAVARVKESYTGQFLRKILK
ncbi:MAG: excinuclease ABC subunit UvrA [Chloroflexi bacterium]|nr:excinuclease ABC subunit UvrA [Chloroflexota bacterium]